MKRLRILALMHPTLVPPDSLGGRAPEEINLWKTEYDIVSTLRELGHEVRPLGVYDELAPIRARRADLERAPDTVDAVLADGNARAQAVAE